MSDDDSSFMHMKKGAYVRAVWLVAMKERDILAGVYRNPGEEWWAGYRWRHYRDTKIFNSDDEKSFFRIHARAGWTDVNVEEVVNAIDTMLHIVAEYVARCEHTAPAEVKRFDVRGDVKKLLAELLLEPNFHIRDRLGRDLKRGGLA